MFRQTNLCAQDATEAFCASTVGNGSSAEVPWVVCAEDRRSDLDPPQPGPNLPFSEWGNLSMTGRRPEPASERTKEGRIDPARA